MLLLVFTGATQFAAVSVIGAGGSTASALGGALLLAARNGVYGLTMARRLPGTLGRRLVAAQLTLDESTAMSAAQSDPAAQRTALWITGLSVFPAGFVAMVWPLLRDGRGRLAAVCGALICVTLIPFVPVGVPILCAALAVLVGVR